MCLLQYRSACPEHGLPAGGGAGGGVPAEEAGHQDQQVLRHLNPPSCLVTCDMSSALYCQIYIEVKKCAGVTKNRLFGNKMWFSVRIR